jgi:retinol dehydrogenase-12
VNYFGPFLLTNLFLPLLAASESARIVNITSAMYAIGRIDLGKPGFIVRKNGFSAYAASKLAMLLFTIELAERLSGMRITANSLHPGLVDTKIMTLGKWYDWFIRRYMDWKAIDVEEGAKTSIYLASSEEVAAVTGKYFTGCAENHPRINKHWLDMRKALWERTSAIVGL